MTNPTSIFAKMARGHHDDAREGILLTKIAAGDLVKVPFGSGTGVGLARVVGSSTASAQANLATNPDSSGTGVNFTISTGLGQSAAWTEILYGSIVGIRWRRNQSATLPPFGVVIDGVAHSVRNSKFRSDTVLASSTDQETLWIVADDLNPDLPHTVTLIIPSDAYGGTTRSLLAYGWLLERSRGYKDPPKWGILSTVPATLNTTTTATGPTSAYRKLLFHNTDTVTRKVTVTYSGSVIRELVLGAAGATTAPFASGELDFGVPVLGVSNLTVKADAAGVVNWMPIFAEVRI